ncbi:MAG TPA: mycothiol synthase [Acidimicrobiia bacterium]
MEWEAYQPVQHRTALDVLLAAVEARDGLPALTEYKLLRVDRPDRSRGSVAVAGDAVAAYVQAAPHRQSDGAEHWAIEIAVAPGAELFHEALEVAVAQVPGGARYVVWAWTSEAQRLLAAAGFTATRTLHRLERPLPIGAGPDWPSHITPSTFRPGIDEEAWLATNNAAFAGHEENGSIDLADLALRTAQPWFDPRGVVMAWDGDVLAGSCWTKLHGDGVGEIYIVGVHPEARGGGLGRALVLAGLADLHDRQGAEVGMLYVDGANEAAMWLYRDLGFRAVFTNCMYERG